MFQMTIIASVWIYYNLHWSTKNIRTEIYSVHKNSKQMSPKWLDEISNSKYALKFGCRMIYAKLSQWKSRIGSCCSTNWLNVTHLCIAFLISCRSISSVSEFDCGLFQKQNRGCVHENKISFHLKNLRCSAHDGAHDILNLQWISYQSHSVARGEYFQQNCPWESIEHEIYVAKCQCENKEANEKQTEQREQKHLWRLHVFGLELYLSKRAIDCNDILCTYDLWSQYSRCRYFI